MQLILKFAIEQQKPQLYDCDRNKRERILEVRSLPQLLLPQHAALHPAEMSSCLCAEAVQTSHSLSLQCFECLTEAAG